MATSEDHRAPHALIEAERAAYLDALPPPDPDWPPGVRIVYDDLRDHLSNLRLRIEDVKQRCGIGNHNISGRFKYFVSRTPQAYAVHHRVALAQRLLEFGRVNITQVAFAVGFASPNGFSTTFKRRVGVSPTAFRRNLRNDL